MTVNETNLKWSGMLSKRRSTGRLVLHHAAAEKCSAEDIHRWHLANGWSGMGYHYLVRKDGSIWRGRPEDTFGAHAKNFNSTSIGVCFEGNFENEHMNEKQLAAGKELIADICSRYKLGVANVCGHRDLNATACPGSNFPFAELAAAAEGAPAKSEDSAPSAKPNDENKVLSFQEAVKADGFALPKFGADGYWGSETASVAKRCVIKRRKSYLHKNATALAQRLLGVTVDGKCGANTEAAIKRFQRENALSVDGECGINTWKMLLEVK